MIPANKKVMIKMNNFLRININGFIQIFFGMILAKKRRAITFSISLK